MSGANTALPNFDLQPVRILNPDEADIGPLRKIGMALQAPAHSFKLCTFGELLDKDDTLRISHRQSVDGDSLSLHLKGILLHLFQLRWSLKGDGGRVKGGCSHPGPVSPKSLRLFKQSVDFHPRAGLECDRRLIYPVVTVQKGAATAKPITRHTGLRSILIEDPQMELRGREVSHEHTSIRSKAKVAITNGLGKTRILVLWNVTGANDQKIIATAVIFLGKNHAHGDHHKNLELPVFSEQRTEDFLGDFFE